MAIINHWLIGSLEAHLTTLDVYKCMVSVLCSTSFGFYFVPLPLFFLCLFLEPLTSLLCYCAVCLFKSLKSLLRATLNIKHKSIQINKNAYLFMHHPHHHFQIHLPRSNFLKGHFHDIINSLITFGASPDRSLIICPC